MSDKFAYEKTILSVKNPRVEDYVRVASGLVPNEFKGTPWAYCNRGVSVFTESWRLDCYMRAYGLMHVRKLKQLLSKFPFSELRDINYDLIDWGCGQALASLCFLDCLQSLRVQAPKSITLVDASEVALKRADFNVATKLRSMKNTDCKTILCLTNLPTPITYSNATNEQEQGIYVHLFSNILDITSIDVRKLADVVVSRPGKHFIYITSVIYNASLYQISAFVERLDKIGEISNYNCYQSILGTYATGRSWGGVFHSLTLDVK